MTLDNDNPDLVCRVLFGFFNSFRGMVFDDDFKERFGVDTFLEVNLTNENKDIELP